MTRRRIFRALIITLGAVTTVAWGPFALFATFGMPRESWEYFAKTWDPMMLFAPMGLLAMIAFWVWAFSNRLASRYARGAFSIAIGLGVLAIVPLSLFGGLAAVGVAAGMLAGVCAIVEMWLPNKALEADRAT